MKQWYRRFVYSLLTGACICTTIGFLLASTSHADVSSPWLSTGPPVLQKDTDLPAGVLPPFSYSGNLDCSQRNFVTRPGRLLPIPQTQISHSSCGIQTDFGAMDPDGYLLFNNSGVAGKTIKYQDSDAKVIPIPGSTTLIHYSSAPISGLYLLFTQNASAAITSTINSLTGEVTYSFNRPDDVALRDKSGKLLAVQTDSLSFSANSQWMVVDSPAVGSTLRVNLKTFEVLPFAPSFNYSIGVAPGAQTAITSDGRYVVVASQGFASFKLYDLSTCTNVPTGAIVAPASCQSRDLWSYMRDQVSGFRSVSTLRFVSNNVLSLYAAYRPTPTGINLVSKYLLAAPGQTIQHSQYLALGDSFASGEGAYTYMDGTDTSNNKCHLSGVSYPFLISSVLNFNSYHSVACSGAKIDDIIDAGEEYTGQAKDGKPRRERDVDTILNTFQPGYIDQLDFVKTNRPQIITISTVGNDIGFGNILKRCLAPGTCYSSYEDRLELLRQINGRFDNLTGMLGQLKAAAPANAQIYVIAYPQLAYPGGDCAINVHLNAQELDFSRLLISYLNSMIKNATQNAGVQYIDTEDALNGHRLCETTSNNIAVNGLTAGNDAPIASLGPLGQESFHPNALGHQLLAEAILGKSNQMTLGQSTPNSAITAPSETNQALLSVPVIGRPINLTSYDNDLTTDTVISTAPLTASIDGSQFALKPGSSYRVTLNGGQTNIGSFTSDAFSNLNFQTSIPSQITSGFNTIDIYGQDQAGETIDISKTVFVALNPNDYDGDGLINDADSCPAISQSGQDIDQDNIDDACDDVIGSAPVVVTPTPPADQPPVDTPPPTDPPVSEPPTQPPPPADPTPPPDLPVDDTPPADPPIDITPPPPLPDLPVDDLPPTDTPPQVNPPPPVELPVEPPDNVPPVSTPSDEPTTPADLTPPDGPPLQDPISPQSPDTPPLQDTLPPTIQNPIDTSQLPSETLPDSPSIPDPSSVQSEQTVVSNSDPNDSSALQDPTPSEHTTATVLATTISAEAITSTSAAQSPLSINRPTSALEYPSESLPSPYTSQVLADTTPPRTINPDTVVKPRPHSHTYVIIAILSLLAIASTLLILIKHKPRP